MTARSRRDDRPAFEIPEFDKEEYIQKEFRDARVSVATILLAIIVALISFALAKAGYSTIIGLLLIILAILMLKNYFPLFKIDISTFEKKNWIGSGMVLFFVWFGLFTMFLNPPFMDTIDPHVKSFDIYTVHNETGENTSYHKDPDLFFNTTISINATVVDNSKVDSVILYITLPDNQTFVRTMNETGTKDNEYTGGTLKLDQQGTYVFRIEAKDTSDNTKGRTIRKEVKAS